MQPDHIAKWTEARANVGLPPPTPADIAQRQREIDALEEQARAVQQRRLEALAEVERQAQDYDPAAERHRLEKAAAEIGALFGLLPMSVEDMDAYAPHVRHAEPQEDPQERRQRRFERCCPDAFQVPWDWSKVHADVKRPEVEKIWGWEFGPRGLYVAGESGHSKTRAVMMLVRRLIMLEGRDVLVLDGIAFSNLCTRAFGDPSQTEMLFRPLVQAEVLLIDDLAKRWTPATEEGAFLVVDRRTSRNRPIIATLNYTTDNLFEMQQARGDLAQVRDVSTPLIRRLVDFCEAVVL